MDSSVIYNFSKTQNSGENILTFQILIKFQRRAESSIIPKSSEHADGKLIRLVNLTLRENYYAAPLKIKTRFFQFETRPKIGNF